MQISRSVIQLLACPICKQRLITFAKACVCSNDECRATFPIAEGKPILLNERNSLFRIKDYLGSKAREGDDESRIRRLVEVMVPSITHNWSAARNYSKLRKLLSRRNQPATVLIVGGRELGVGLERLLCAENIDVVETDVHFGPRTSLIADGHDLPFLDGSFDAVIIQAVLEHVLDPHRCVGEIHRVLKPDGMVYAETPFMYPVHLGAHDFTRFSMSAHRRLFRHFSDIDSGMASGPGVALALAIRSFLLSLSTSRVGDAFAIMILPFFIFWLKYVDYFLVAKPRAADFAATLYFMGRKAGEPVTDEEIINGHWSQRRDVGSAQSC